ncbi:hypothetical protein QOT17_002782 [Balamuthia mandrillaris]
MSFYGCCCNPYIGFVCGYHVQQYQMQQYLTYVAACQQVQMAYMASQCEVRTCWNDVCGTARQMRPNERAKFQRKMANKLLSNAAPAVYDFASNLVSSFL